MITSRILNGRTLASGLFRRNAKRVCLSMAAAVLVSGTSHALTITGEINFFGSFTPTGGTGLADATGLSFGPSYVFTSSGSFSSLAMFSPATLAPFTFAPLASPVPALWTAGDFSYTLESIDINLQTPTELSLSGFGILSGPGYDQTEGNWNFKGGTLGTLFTFWAEDPVSGLPDVTIVPEPDGENVPEGGNAALLLGIAAIGLGACRFPKFVV